ncbi:HTH-type transcriptional regulator CdhR [Corynebacterium kalinowskii]|uniref:HTH-type transcriptional regulator CdhR n=1 Tax=Corynebacterium kalinowskii TaxID=2675216 RepID=A0A6B8VPN7_9CORY|nr:helix-turn-helix domain-containing protein [Corynebacterium kalinowskii]QGU00995.1 HTH-type transcriptional regulator CdhR [Corynebacterium kalinowskii]
MKQIGLLVFDGVTLLDVSGPAEVLSRAPGYELTLFSPRGGNVRSASGLSLTATKVASAEIALDTLIIAGSDTLPDAAIDPALLEAARILATSARRIASVCTGAFILAEIGELNGRRATTHWKNTADLARRYPDVLVEPDVLHVHDGRYISSAGISAGIDLALSLVEEDHGPRAAREIAQDMVVFMHRPGGQSQFIGARRTPQVESEILHAVLDHVTTTLTQEHSVTSMAAAASVSARHLTRLFHQELGTTPMRWLELMRLNQAKQLILEGATVTSAARDAGFGTDEKLRRAFARHLGITPRDYRARFRSTF